jgi:hypothetical protein
VNDLFLMRIMHGGGDGAEQLKPLQRRQLVRVAEYVDRKAFDIIHDEVRKAVFGGAAIQECGYIRVVEVGQNLPLMAEAAENGVSIHSALDELDRNLLLILSVCSDRQVDGSHATVPDLSQDLIRPDTISRCKADLIIGDEFGSYPEDRRLNETAGLIVGSQQRLDFASQIWILGTGSIPCQRSSLIFVFAAVESPNARSQGPSRLFLLPHTGTAFSGALRAP